jgi:hypothetical protein
MEPFLHAITSFPTVPLTVILGVVVGYWIFALVTGVTHDVGADAATGAIKGASEAVAGAIKGTAEAVAHGEVGGHDAGGDAGGDHDGSDGQDGGLLSVLGLGKVPVTITMSVALLLAWTVCTLATLWLVPVNALFQAAVLAGSLITGLLASALVLRPLGKALDAERPARRRDALGHVCTITSGKVDAKFGTALVEDGAAGLNVHVVCPKANTLKKGDRALLVEFDAAREVYEVEPIDWLMPQEIEALNDPARAAQIISGRVRRR